MPGLSYAAMSHDQEWEPWMVYVLAGIFVVGVVLLVVVIIKDHRWRKKHGFKP